MIYVHCGKNKVTKDQARDILDVMEIDFFLDTGLRVYTPPGYKLPETVKTGGNL